MTDTTYTAKAINFTDIKPVWKANTFSGTQINLRPHVMSNGLVDKNIEQARVNFHGVFAGNTMVGAAAFLKTAAGETRMHGLWVSPSAAGSALATLIAAIGSAAFSAGNPKVWTLINPAQTIDWTSMGFTVTNAHFMAPGSTTAQALITKTFTS